MNGQTQTIIEELNMILRAIKIIIGLLIIQSSITEYSSFVKENGKGIEFVLIILILLVLFGLLLIYSGIKDKKLLELFPRKKI